MKRLYATTTSVVIACGIASGCTSQQMYASGQAYQRNQCQRMPDQGDREKCQGSANTSYDSYKREGDTASK